MKDFRAPAIPLITVDPYFSVWSKRETLNFDTPMHWTGAANTLFGKVTVDGTEYLFLGYDRNCRKLPQTDLQISALSTVATYEGAGIRLRAAFMTPLLPDDLCLLSRPVSYLELSYQPTDGRVHTVSASVSIDESFCLDKPLDSPVEVKPLTGLCGLKIGNTVQKPLNRSGDNLRIDWGYAALAAAGDAAVSSEKNKRGITSLTVKVDMAAAQKRLILFGYDDLGASINYFGDILPSLWNKDGKTVDTAMAEAAREYEALSLRAQEFSTRLHEEAVAAGGEEYAALLDVAYRQVIAGHKLAVDKNGDVLYISKECFSNGCAATVDVSYPSIPLFVRYAPELVRGMMRPIYRYAASDAWGYDFAPHDVGQYPLLTGQVYGKDEKTGALQDEFQMPVEECGNMIIMETAATLTDGNADFALSHMQTLTAWGDYLIRFGDDPENQLCTDDFAGHLAHNCNLSVKAIMGIVGLSLLFGMTGNREKAAEYRRIAEEKAAGWCKRARNADGTFRLAFDAPDTFSMKYNMVWDKLWGTGLFPEAEIRAELDGYLNRINRYGMPLDSRAEYTKSDWLVWTATMLPTKEKFEAFIHPLFAAYDETVNRVPLGDWYDTFSADMLSFRHRTVQGGLFIKLLEK